MDGRHAHGAVVGHSLEHLHDDSTSVAMYKPIIFVGVALFLVPTSARGQATVQPATGVQVAATAGGLVSFQPATEGESGAYMNNAVSGTVPGFLLGFSVSEYEGWSLTVELSTGATMETVQTGRFSSGPTLGKHRDSFISFLPGHHKGGATWSTTYVAGASYVFSQSESNGVLLSDRPSMGNVGGSFALTGGIDVDTRNRSRLALIGSIRYFYVFRGEDVFHIGLGHNVVRASAGVRIALRGP